MDYKRLSRNAPCPCESGKKYKRCCFDKGFQWVEDDDGNICKSIPVDDEISELLGDMRQSFVTAHGRQPGVGDRVFPNMPPPEQAEHQVVEAMKKAGLDPAFIYAFEKTGRLVVESSQHLLSDRELDEWNAAMEQYYAEHN